MTNGKQGYLYATATILAPSRKLQAFQTDAWRGDDADWAKEYERFRNHSDDYPILARIARDTLCVPATGAGVERMFNYARDLCHYRRGSLKPETIENLMLYMCSTKFETEEDRLQFIRASMLEEQAAIGSHEYSDEIENPEEEVEEEIQVDDVFNYISDDDVEEVDEEVSVIGDSTPGLPCNRPKSPLKRTQVRRSVYDDDDDLIIIIIDSLNDKENLLLRLQDLPLHSIRLLSF
ncbi:uncharacterized protein N7483_008868 [Penicillium malachiteum]|uniref:uncharacterized protein n=1 Tax=Penicillium malachiteum TaxID=1324776 RepID=UPI002547B9A4|nr:uncharacterized protein N7483_008868 [Penicillium malachiteum]KAJ5720934.1 hypothetical protein N7483_008868 [Penicillium malachiteum]